MLISLEFFVWIVTTAIVLGSLIAKHRFLATLRAVQPDVWEQLGRPVVFMNTSPSNMLEIEVFLWSGKYRTFEDRTLTRLGNMSQILEAIGLLGLLVLFTGVAA